MTNSQRLRKIIDESGYKIGHVASEVGLSYQGLVNKINDIPKFRAHEIAKICKLLKIDGATREKIFFTNDVEPQSTSSECEG